MKVGLAQISPVWLHKEATLEKVIRFVNLAGEKGCNLVVFGEALVPGYPFWLSFTHGSAFESDIQKDLHAFYIQEAVQIEKGDLSELCQVAKEFHIAIYLGVIERPADRGGHSLYCSLVYIDQQGLIQSVHRKLQPTYEERLAWSLGDGNGLQTHALNGFTVGGLNCWENWMPLPRAALYGQGENVHVAVWPGSIRNTEDITRFIAKESRSFVLSVSGLLKADQMPSDLPHFELLQSEAPAVMANGGSCVAGPDGQWILPPQPDKEDLFVADLELGMVYRERQNFDPSGHYSRPDVTRLEINQERQAITKKSPKSGE